MIKTVVFDIGDVLVDADWRRFFADQDFDEEMVERLGAATIAGPHWKEFDRGILSEAEILQRFISEAPGIAAEIRQACSNLTGYCRRQEFAIPWIQELKGKGLTVLVLSNWFEKLYRESTEALDFLEYTDGGIFSWREQMIKPDPEIYELLLERYRLKASESVFLDNTLENVEGARDVGMYGIHFKSYEQAHEELEQLITSIK